MKQRFRPVLLLLACLSAAAVCAWGSNAIAGAPSGASGRRPGSDEIASVCNGRVELSYPEAPLHIPLDEPLLVQIHFSTGHIQGGKRMVVDRVRFGLDCAEGSGGSCTDTGPFVVYQEFVKTDCPTTWTVNSQRKSPYPNTLIFTADPPLLVPEREPDYCTLTINVMAVSYGVGLGLTEMAILGQSPAGPDAWCDTTPPLPVVHTSVAVMSLCPPCVDLDPCTTDRCDTKTGQCIHDPIDCDDGDACTADSCDPQAGCVHDAKDCDDGDPCTADACDPATGGCAHFAHDGAPPSLSLTVTPDSLWPPDHRIVPVTVTVRTADTCDAHPQVSLISVDCRDDGEDRGRRHRSGDIQGAVIGSDDRQFLLRAERGPKGSGRSYTVTYRVVDRAGNAAEASATVSVRR